MSGPCLCRWLSCNQNRTRVSEAKSSCPIKAIAARDRTGRVGLTNTRLGELAEMIDGLRDRLRDFESTLSDVQRVQREDDKVLPNEVISLGIQPSVWEMEWQTQDVCISLAHCRRDYYFPRRCLPDSVDSSNMYCNRWCRCRMSTTFKAVFPVWFPLKSRYWWLHSNESYSSQRDVWLPRFIDLDE